VMPSCSNDRVCPLLSHTTRDQDRIAVLVEEWIMNTLKSNADQTGTWVLSLALFCVGIDGLALVVFVKVRSASFVSIPILLAWQAVALIYFLRGFLPAYKRLDEMHSDLSTVYLRLFRIGQTLLMLISVVLSYAIGVVRHS
jgi:hypothetical protein